MKIFNICEKYLMNHKGSLTIYFFITIFVGLFALVNPFLIGNFIDSLIDGGTMTVVYRFAIVFTIINILKTSLNYITMIIYTKTQTKIAHGFSQDIIEHTHKTSLSFINKNDTNYLSQVINGDTNMLVIFCISIVQNFILNGIHLILPTIILFNLNPSVAGVLMIFLVLYILIYKKFKNPLFARSMSHRIAQNKYFATLMEQLKFTKFIKIHVLGKLFRNRMDKSVDELLDETLRMQKLNFTYSSLDTAVTTLVQIALFLIGGWLILNGNFTIGMFTIFSMYFNMMLGSAKYFFSFGKSYQDNLVSYERLTEILSTPIESHGTTEVSCIHEIQLKNLNFSYVDTQGKPIISNLSASLKKGNVYGILGKNGAGKSTLINLILGMYIDERGGDILINGTSSKSLDMIHIRKHYMGISEQEPVILNESIPKNIFGLIHKAPTSNLDKNLSRYAEKINFAEVLNRPYDDDKTKENGSLSFSGGEKQKLSILRLMLKNPDVMIFDEPTSALDIMSTKSFVEYIQEVKKDKIIIIITHDDHIASICDEIISLS